MAVTSLDNHLHRFCGGRYHAADETVTVRLSGMQAQVTRGLFRCAKCGDEQRTVEQREAAERDAVERMRAAHGLLTPREIRQLREAVGLTRRSSASCSTACRAAWWKGGSAAGTCRTARPTPSCARSATARRWSVGPPAPASRCRCPTAPRRPPASRRPRRRLAAATP
jgi:hypothetical protein